MINSTIVAKSNDLTERLNGMADELIGQAMVELEETGTYMARVVVIGENDSVHIMPLSISSDSVANIEAEIKIRVLVKEAKAKATIFASEIFLSHNSGIRPSHDPHRKEGIMASCEHAGGSFIILQTYRREENGKIRWTERTEEEGPFEGRFSNLLSEAA